MAFSEPPPAAGCVSATINSTVYVWGGKTESGDTSHLANVYILDTSTEKWQSRPITGQQPLGFYNCAAAQVGNLLYVYGGWDEYERDTGSLYCLDLELFSWKELSPHIYNAGPKAKSLCGMVFHEDKIFLFGGKSGDMRTNEMHVFNLSTGMYS